ncbi:MAG TPA: prepilin-type N-terminal cleavage/methylation domain-containing protein [Gemmataceae bacterium]|jgi:type II secretory pathway pseudopilin PulG
MTTAARRRAVTLVEVLIAIFLMGIGLMAILSLFPLGAAQMAQALKDQRCAEAATNAAAVGRVLWRQTCEDDPTVGANKFTVTRLVTDQTTQPATQKTVQYPFSNQQFVIALDDPSYLPPFTDPSYLPPNPLVPAPPNLVPDSNSNSPLVADTNLPNDRYTRPTSFVSAMPAVPSVAPNGPSYPVFVDPIGFSANAANTASGQPTRQHQLWLPTAAVAVGNTNVFWRIPRRTLYVRDTTANSIPQPWLPLGSGSLPQNGSLLPSTQRIFKLFSLTDDQSYNFNGTPDLDGDPRTPELPALATTRRIERQGRYTWAYLFRRRNNADRTNVDVSVVLYSGRSIDVPSLETAYPATAQFPAVNVGQTPTTKRLTVTYGSGTKPAVRRGGWILDATLVDAGGGLAPQGIFYRVVNVDDSTTGLVDLELQTPIAGVTQTAAPPQTNQTTQRVVVVMENVVEVFTRQGVTHVAPPLPY